MVTGGSSGEERIAATAMVTMATPASAITSSLTRSYGTDRIPR
jgi:hypothetical protein